MNTYEVSKKGLKYFSEWRINKNRIFYTVLTIILFIVALLYIFFISQKYYFNVFFSSDSAGELMLGKLLSETGGIITKDWYYSTELRVLHNQLISKILFKFSNNPLVIQPFLAVIGAFQMGIGAFFCFKTLKLPSWKGFLAATIVITPFCFDTLLIYLINSYYTFFVFNVFIYIGLYILITENKNRKIILISKILLFILSFLMGLCGIRYFLIIIVPMVLYTAIQFFQKNIPLKIKDFFKQVNLLKELQIPLIFGSFIFSVMGYFIYNNIFTQYYNIMSVKDFMYYTASPESFINKLFQIPGLILSSMGLEQYPITSFSGLMQLIKMCFVMLFIFSIYLFWKKRNFLSSSVKKYIYIALCILITNSGMLIFLGGNGDIGEAIMPRYFVLGLIPTLLFVVLIIDGAVINIQKQIVSILLIVSMFICSAYLLEKKCSLIASENPRASFAEMVNYLEKEDLTLGYATFWQANEITVTSNYKSQTTPLVIDGMNNIAPQKWLYPVSFDDTFYSKEGQYIVLTPEENENDIWQSFITENNGVKSFENNKFIVYILNQK